MQEEAQQDKFITFNRHIKENLLDEEAVELAFLTEKPEVIKWILIMYSVGKGVKYNITEESYSRVMKMLVSLCKKDPSILKVVCDNSNIDETIVSNYYLKNETFRSVKESFEKIFGISRSHMYSVIDMNDVLDRKQKIMWLKEEGIPINTFEIVGFVLKEHREDKEILDLWKDSSIFQLVMSTLGDLEEEKDMDDWFYVRLYKSAVKSKNLEKIELLESLCTYPDNNEIVATAIQSGCLKTLKLVLCNYITYNEICYEVARTGTVQILDYLVREEKISILDSSISIAVSHDNLPVVQRLMELKYE